MKTILDTDHDFFCDINALCFQLLSAEETDLVKASKTQVLFRKGDNLTKQGAFASYILFVIKGLALQYIEGEMNRSFNLRIVKPGEFVGLSSVFTKNIFNYSTVALTDCQVILVEKETIAHVVKQNGEFAFNLFRRYSEQNANLAETLHTMLFKQMTGRLAESLLYLDNLKTAYPDVFLLLSRKNLADFAGISTESAVKLLKSFEQEAIINLHDQDIIIADKNRLEKISKNG
jgi:CRP/FNR family transcriptional regulator